MSSEFYFETRKGKIVQGLALGTGFQTQITLANEDITALSTSEFAALRCELGPYHQVSWTGSRLTDSLLWWEEHFVLWRSGLESSLYSPHAAHSHLAQDEIFTNVFPDGENFILLEQDQSFDIPVQDLPHHPVSRFLLGETVDAYRAFLEDCAITHMPIVLPPLSLVKHVGQNFVRPLVMRCTDNWSGLISINDLHLPYGTRVRAHVLPPNATELVEETFKQEQLSPWAQMLKLEPRDYTLSALESHVRRVELKFLLSPVLRQLRGGADLPANYATFTSPH